MGCSSGPDIVEDGLVFCLDAGSKRSYPGTGTTWTDTVGGDGGTLTNGPTFSSANGGCIVFDGANDNIVFSDKDEYSFGNYFSDSPFSIELYFNCDNVGSGAIFKGLIGKDTSVYREWALLIVSSTKKARVFIKNQGGGNQQSIDTTSALLDDTWYHVVATYNGVGGTSAYTGLKLYLNGDFESVSSASNQAYTAMSNTSANLTVGNYYGSNNYFNGNISVVRLYNRALTADEIRRNYLSTKERYQ